MISTFSTELAKRLDKPGTKKFTAESFRRSACTQLAKAGISIIGLYKAGNQKSLETTQKYTEYSVISTENRMSMLDRKKRSAKESKYVNVIRIPFKQSHATKTATVTTKELSSVTTNTNTSCAMINIFHQYCYRRCSNTRSYMIISCTQK